MAGFLFRRHLIPSCIVDPIRKRTSVLEQPYPIPPDERDESDFCLHQPAVLLFLYISPSTCPFLTSFNPRSFFLRPCPQSSLLFLPAFFLSRLLYSHSSVFISFICFGSMTPINIHLPTIYFNNVILICMSTFKCSSYAHLSHSFTSTPAVSLHCSCFDFVLLDVLLLDSECCILAAWRSTQKSHCGSASALLLQDISKQVE